MNIKTEANIHENWDNVYDDRNGQSIDCHNEDNTLCVYHGAPATFIRAFRNAICAGCSCTKLQDMDLPDHAIKNLREIATILTDKFANWHTYQREAEKEIEAVETE